MRFSSFVVVGLLAATGCVGDFVDGGMGDDDGSGSNPGGGGEAEQLYKTTVHTIVEAKCGQAACHGQPGVTGMYGFGTADKDSSYTQVTTTPLLVGTYTVASAPILLKIKQPGGHNSVVYTPSDEASIGAWLAKEAQERTGGGQPPPVDPVAKLREWSGCMSLANFETAEMAIAWNVLASVQNQRCANCHQSGLDTFLTGTGNAANFFNGLTAQKDFLIKYFTVDATGAVVINSASMANAATTLPNHPRFNPTDNIGMTALNEFYTLTQARLTAATCDPPRLPM
ncbi:MAG: hypothetical protein ACKV2T_33440 [Kofleriaceae bacterium]